MVLWLALLAHDGDGQPVHRLGVALSRKVLCMRGLESLDCASSFRTPARKAGLSPLLPPLSRLARPQSPEDARLWSARAAEEFIQLLAGQGQQDPNARLPGRITGSLEWRLARGECGE